MFPPEDLQEQYYMFIVCTGLMGVFSTVNNKLVNTLKPGQTFFESALATKPFDIHFRAIRSTAIIILKTNNFIHFLGVTLYIYSIYRIMKQMNIHQK